MGEIHDPWHRVRVWLSTFNTAEEAAKVYYSAAAPPPKKNHSDNNLASISDACDSSDESRNLSSPTFVLCCSFSVDLPLAGGLQATAAAHLNSPSSPSFPFVGPLNLTCGRVEICQQKTVADRPFCDHSIAGFSQSGTGSSDWFRLTFSPHLCHTRD
ncbi:ethylene-responsive transcription factor CRF1-like [Musa acuminata AAA Group]|uniref:ethylene-responsive transcription factor CRF1-like n=1 Tax=Musa acuminata AAA Group TaxID=214697 RepID=UPI0031E45F05